jgi:hypothetical protein
MPTARLIREQSPATTYSVALDWPENDGSRTLTVLVGESYGVASQLTDALNAQFGHVGALAALGRNAPLEIQELAANIARTYR